jgi:DNA-binding Lrp family transcriptional regulator
MGPPTNKQYSPTEQLGEIDIALFRELQVDGRVPFNTLAEHLGVSETFVRRRVNKLSDADVFSITAVADPRVLGLAFMAWIGLVVRPSTASSVAAALVELPQVDYVVQSAGSFNVMAEVACRSRIDLRDLLTIVRQLPGVRHSETFVYLNLIHQRFQWVLGDEGAGTRATGNDRQFEPLDIELIRQLQQDGRASFRDLARRLRVSERLVSSRFSRLVAENVLQVIAVGNPLTLGFGAMAWLGIHLAEEADSDAVASALGRAHGIDYVLVPTGRFDLMAEIVCRDREELVATLEEEVGAIEGIDEIETFFYLRLLYKSTAGAWGADRLLTRKSRALLADEASGVA